MTEVCSFDPAPREVACFGAIHADLIAHADRSILPETSTPGEIVTSPGGVATNVARALARLGVPCALAGYVGDDGEGRHLTDLLASEGIDINAVSHSHRLTGRYLALHDPDGSLVAAVVDSAITDTLPRKAFSPTAPCLLAAAMWFMDANLPPQTLEQICEDAGSRWLAADAVSIAKAGRLKPLLPRLDLVFLNRNEAAELSGLRPDTDITTQLSALAEMGVKAAVVTDGAKALHWLSGSARGVLTPQTTTVVDVTGAGDALVAGTLAALARNIPLAAAAEIGSRAAALTIAHAGAVSDDISWTNVAPNTVTSSPAAPANQ